MFHPSRFTNDAHRRNSVSAIAAEVFMNNAGEQTCSPLIAEKEEVSNCDDNRLEQEQPAQKTPRRLGLALCQSHFRLQRRLRENKRRHHFSRILPGHVPLVLNQVDRFLAVAFGQRLYCLSRKIVFHSWFLRQSDRRSLPEKNAVRLPDFHLTLSEPHESLDNPSTLSWPVPIFLYSECVLP